MRSAEVAHGTCVLTASLLCFAWSLGPIQQESDPYVGRFRHAEFEIVLARAESFYQGWLEIRGFRFDLFAREEGNRLEGYFMLDGGRYEFSAKAEDDGLTVWLPLARSWDDARRSFGEWRKVRYRARRVPEEWSRDTGSARVLNESSGVASILRSRLG